MPIKNTDIVLFQSQDNTDNDNGGGRRINEPVADGAVNNLFPDISRVDTVAGDVALRKVFPVVNTDDRDVYYGAHAMIRKPPSDPRVNALLFYSDSAVDTRSEVQQKIESYLVPSYEAPFYLFGTNVEGAKAATFLQRVEEQPPTVGEVYLLKEGSKEQYVRLADVNSTVIKLFYNGQDYTRRRVIVTLEQSLQTTFNGSTFVPEGKQLDGTSTFATQVADAAKFYGTKAIDQDLAEGDTLIEVDNIFQQLVPSSKQQIPIINSSAVGRSTLVVYDKNAPSTYRTNTYLNLSSGESASIGLPIVPGSVEWDNTVDNNGLLIKDGTVVGTINYTDGAITVSTSRLNGTFYYKQGKLLETYTQFSEGVYVTLENQGLVFIKNVAPVPDPQSTYVDYRANGKWYRIRGNVDGSMGNADDGLGAGAIIDNGDGTATITVTLGALPEIESTVIFAWGSSDIVDDANARLEENPVWWELQLDPFINPDDFSIQVGYWGASSTINAVTNTNSTTVDGITFVNTSVNSREIYILNTTTGLLRIYAQPGKNMEGRVMSDVPGNLYYGCNATYTYGIPEDLEDEKVLEVNPSYTNDTPGVFVLSTSPDVIKSSVDLVITVKQSTRGIVTNPWNTSESIPVTADQDGILRDSEGDAWGQVGNDGTVTIEVPSVTGNFMEERNAQLGGRYYVKVQGTRLKYEVLDIGQLEYYATTNRTYPSAKTDFYIRNTNLVCKVVTPQYIVNDFRIAVLSSVKPNYGNGIRNVFEVVGSEVISTLVPGEVVGTYNRITGLLAIDISQSSDDNLLSNTGSVTPKAQADHIATLDPRDNYYSLRHAFKVGSGDIVNSSLVVRYQTENGLQVATSNADGVITGGDIDSSKSYVDTITGAVNIEFLNPALPSSIVYDCVAETTLPLDPELLGLNPVRLPSDGRVPIFFPGAFLVIFNEQETDIGTPAAGESVTLSRNRQSYIEVVDVDGQRLAYNQYSTNRLAGSVTFNAGLELVDRQGNALTPPLRVIDRVEDMGLCTEASVNGRVSISAPLSRDYLAGDSYISSALVWGDIGARIFNIFSQQSFDQWSDEQTQSGIPAQFDNVNFPIQINNKDSFTGRWALVFTSNTTVNVISETLGTILEDVGIDTDIAPINPATGNPYFTIPSGGWGGGWTISNVLRFNTTSGAENMWVIRSVQSGALTEQTDSIDIEIRGDVN